MSVWKFVKVAPMRVSPYAVSAYGGYVSQRDIDRDLEPETTMRLPYDDPDLEGPYGPEPFEDWVQQKVQDQEYVYTVVLNPGEGRMPLEQSLEWTRRSFERLEHTHDQDLDYRFWVHDDLDKHSHVHAVLSSPEELSPEVVRDFRFQAGRAWQEIEPYYRLEPSQDVDGLATRSPEPDRKPEPEPDQYTPQLSYHGDDYSI
jgi:hypothetical protein